MYLFNCVIHNTPIGGERGAQMGHLIFDAGECMIYEPEEDGLGKPGANVVFLDTTELRDEFKSGFSG